MEHFKNSQIKKVCFLVLREKLTESSKFDDKGLLAVGLNKKKVFINSNIIYI